jgi:hypothetical protein
MALSSEQLPARIKLSRIAAPEEGYSMARVGAFVSIEEPSPAFSPQEKKPIARARYTVIAENLLNKDFLSIKSLQISKSKRKN